VYVCVRVCTCVDACDSECYEFVYFLLANDGEHIEAELDRKSAIPMVLQCVRRIQTRFTERQPYNSYLVLRNFTMETMSSCVVVGHRLMH